MFGYDPNLGDISEVEPQLGGDLGIGHGSLPDIVGEELVDVDLMRVRHAHDSVSVLAIELRVDDMEAVQLAAGRRPILVARHFSTLFSAPTGHTRMHSKH